ncbi:hypothetical protein NMG60_11025973 [Bertholletia excelsa]
MVVRDLEIKMRAGMLPSRVDTVELKLQIERKIGHEKAEKYFQLFNRFLSLQLNKPEFNRHCIGILGRENICLHNRLVRAIIKNAYVAKSPPPKEGKIGSSLNAKVPNGYQRSSLQSLCREVFPRSPRKGRTPNLRDRKFRDRPSPLGPHGKTNGVECEECVPKNQEQQSATDMISLGSRPPREVNSVEEGEEVERAAGSPVIYCRSPVRAPLGIFIHGRETRKVLCNGPASAFYIESCSSSSELPDTNSLKTRLEQKFEKESLAFPMDCVNLLNNGLDVYLKRLIKPCLELAVSKSGNDQRETHKQMMIGLNGMRPMRYALKTKRPISASFLDFQVAMESNPQRLGEDWPIQLEKICLRASD